jgi:hypothetical protein
MCPEPALLVAYLDGTLFHRDADAIDAHLETCASCSDLLAAMRHHREIEERSRRMRIWRRAGIAVCALALLATGVWAAMGSRPGPALSSASTPSVPVAPVTPPVPEPRAPVERPAPAVDTTPPAARAAAPAPRATDVKSSKAPTETPKGNLKEIPTETPKERPAAIEPPPAVQTDAGLVLRGRNANRRIAWRARDRVIEHSTDGGATWVVEHTADRTIHGGAFVNADVAWIVGENGLILRRTKNGWFGANAPAEATITSVSASSPSKATVRLEDGRAFTTDNGGVTWSPQ